MKKEYFVSDEVWNYRFLWIEKELYLGSKRKYIEQNLDVGLADKERVVERLFLSAKYLFDFCVTVLEPELGSAIRLEKVSGKNIRVPLETLYNDEFLGYDTKAIISEWRYVTVNMNSLEDIAEKLLKGKSCTVAEREKYVEDWCQYLEGAVVQELAHVLFLEDVIKDNKRKKLFVEQMNNYPNMDDSLSSDDRQEKYLIADIEKHGRLVELDFLSKIYPDSWAEAWVKNDLVKV